MAADASLQSRLSAASSFILQSPPGEVNDVLNDVRPLIGDDAALRTGLLPALTQYNLEQFTVVELPGMATTAMICASAQYGGKTLNRFLHPASRHTFAFDQFTLTASELEAYTPPHEESDRVRQAIEEHVAKYVEERYEGGVSAVFTVGEEHVETKPGAVAQPIGVGVESEEPDPQTIGDPVTDNNDMEEDKATEIIPVDDGQQEAEIDTTPAPESEDINVESDPSPHEEITQEDNVKETKADATPPPAPQGPPSHQFRIHLVGNKYNPHNYWTGRWRGTYDVDMETGSIQGQVCVHVHYYEQGNVQLSTTYTPSLTVSTSPTPQEVVKAIDEVEQEYQSRLHDTYTDLGDKAFRQLRRALPITKQKMDWDKVGVYTLGTELTK